MPVEAKWGIVELMGRRRSAGRITEERGFGVTMCRVEVPHGDGFASSLYGSHAIYGIHFTDEATARSVASSVSPPRGVHALVAGAGSDDGESDDDVTGDPDPDDAAIDPTTCGHCGADLVDAFVGSVSCAVPK